MTRVFSPRLVLAHNPSPMTGAGNNTYLVADDRGAAALIDAGVGEREHLDDLASALTEMNARLALVLVTHGHRDHAAGAPVLARAHPMAAFAKFPWPGEDERYPVLWRTLADEQPIDAGGVRLVAVHTPGHSPDHVSFWHEPSRTVFSGDLVVLGSSVMIHTSRGGRLSEYLASLERLRTLAPARLLPAHGPAVENPEALLAGYIEHRLARERQVVAALAAGDSTVPGIAESIYHGLDPALMPAARENVLAHLEKLRDEGRATRADDERWQLS